MKSTITRLLFGILFILSLGVPVAQAAVFNWDSWQADTAFGHSSREETQSNWHDDWLSRWQSWRDDRFTNWDWSFTPITWNWSGWDWNWEPRPDPDDDYEVPASCPLTQSELAAITNFPPMNGPIIAFGDSLTAGVGASSGQDYVSQLEDMADVNIINAGMSGDTTEDALARLEEDVLAHDPATVIVWLGGNDILQRYYAELYEEAGSSDFIDEIIAILTALFGKLPDPDEVISESETFTNIETIVEEIQDAGAVVILIGIDGGEFNESLGDEYAAIAAETGAIFVPDVLDDILGRPSRTSDLIHPNNVGYEIVAERIYPAFSCTL